MSYTNNKEPKDAKFLRVMRKAINKDMKLNSFSLEEEANELGLSQGTLEQKLKPSAPLDFTVSEMTHLMDLSGDYSPLEYLAKKYGFNLVEKTCCEEAIETISDLADNAIIESQDVFSEVKKAIKDGEIDQAEKEKILKEIEESEKSTAELKSKIQSLHLN